jgi:polar amino acid transport system substrate-binding protein
MSGSDIVGRKQYVAGVQHERFTIARAELERTIQRDDILSLWGLVPIERRMRRRLLESNRPHVDKTAFRHARFPDVRRSVGPDVKLYRAYHRDGLSAATPNPLSAMPHESATQQFVVASAYPDPPFDVVENGELTGFDVELMRAICALLRRSMQPVRYTGDDFNAIFDGLRDGRYDAVISGTTITPERAEHVLFSDAYLEFGQAVAVSAKRVADIRTTADLRGSIVGIQKGNTSDAVARALLADGIIASIHYYAYDAIETALDDLEAEKTGAVIKLTPVLHRLIASRPSLRVALEVPTHERLGIAVAKTNSGLRDEINGALRALQADGTISALRTRWNC